MNTLIVITGPTAVGKTELCLRIAEKFNIPVINADSRQIFRGMQIGTAAPTPEQRKRVRHYFVDLLELDEYYNASMYEQDVMKLLYSMFKDKDNAIALLTGGSMMYIDAVCNGIDDIPTISDEVRLLYKQRLEKEGLLNRNKMLPFAALPLKVGLITGETTAAFKDFTTTLAHSGFSFEVIPGYAKMQGNETEATVLAALAKLQNIPDLDAVCIVRGGGSKTDLNYFDSEALCRAIALFPVPVLTGIGHQIDESLVDQVSYRSCITPTDCAKFLVARAEEAKRSLREVLLQIATASQRKLSESKDRLHRTETNISTLFGKRLASERQKLSAIARDIARAPARTLEREREKLRRDIEGLRFGVQKIIALQKAKFELVEEKVKANDPKRILSRGYSYTTGKNGLIKNASDVKPGDALLMHFADGNVQAIAK